jgi:nitroimidazol reductase NimA-like FMN-containing flavoprotein (pyridoxamine 5'-phosphate oxidase superfamily)
MAPLTKEGLDAFLAEPLIARLGVVTPEGDPYVVPLWYDWDGIGIVIAVRARARFVPYLRERHRACVSIAEDRDRLRRVLITGPVEILRDEAPDRDEWLDRSRAICRRYLGESAGDDYQDETVNQLCVWMRIVAEQITSWDSPAWHPRYLT